MRLIKPLGAALTVAALIAGPPWALVRFIGNPWPAEGISLSAPLTDGAIIGLLAAIVWILWAQLATCILTEAVAAVSDDRIQLRVPFTLAVQQHLARRLVTAIVLAAVSTSFGATTALATTAQHATPAPATPATLGASHAYAAVQSRVGRTEGHHAQTHHNTRQNGAQNTRQQGRSGNSAATSAGARSSAEDGHSTVTVMRLDSLWSIAERVLGEGDRWPEIAELNEGLTMSDGTIFTSADHIKPGWELQVPTDASIGESHPEDRGVHQNDHQNDHQDGGQDGERSDAARRITIEKGDTLSQIALDELGDADDYPAIAHASQNITQRDGHHLTDPDVIDVGWTLKIPTHLTPDAHPQPETHPGADLPGSGRPGTDKPPTDDEPSDHLSLADQPDDHRPPQAIPGVTPRADSATPVSTPTPQATQLPTQPSSAGTPTARTPTAPAPTAMSQAQATHPTSSQGVQPGQRPAGDDTENALGDGSGDQADRNVTGLRALLASAACLAAGAAALLATNRRRQFRRRRIGRMIAAVPPELADVEQAIVEQGCEARSDVGFLDRALRLLATQCRADGDPLPQVGAAVLSADELTLLFTHPTTARHPAGWTATDDSRAWTLTRSTDREPELSQGLQGEGEGETQPAPYPALVSIGQDDAGRTWLIDLETVGVCGIGGAPRDVENLMRFMVAELAVNAWSQGSEVLLADQFGAETIALNPARLRQVDRAAALTRAAALAAEMSDAEENLSADLLTRRRDELLLDTSSPLVVALASHPDQEPFNDFLAATGADLERRARTRIVVIHPDAEAPAIVLTGAGMAYLPTWGVSLKAFMLPAAEGAAMAALLAATRNVEDEPVPAVESDDGPLGSYVRADGSLREEYTAPRHTEGNDPSSMLPGADEVYLAAAATTAQDLAAIAPSIPEQTRAELEAIDPTLDQDITDWFDDSSTRPKVHLLGSVNVTARNGGDPDSVDNLGGTISFIAYLVTQERGVTGERAAAAFGWKTQRTVQNRATNARFLLGTRPDGGEWLPDASTSQGARRGAPTYGLVQGVGGVLNSADLFRRLRLRAQRRGDDGCEQDLVTALSLVTGAPFEAATDRRFPWLFQGQRHDDVLIVSILDTAHLLATRALAQGRTDLVRLACETARTASPHSDVAWLDLAAATEADSGHAAADNLVRERVVDRVDEDLPARTEQVLKQRGWASG